MRRWPAYLCSALLAPLLALAAGTAAPAAAADMPTVGPWHATALDHVASPFSGQGLTTVGSRLWYDGSLSVPLPTYLRGWQHVGDPDSAYGYVVEPYQWKPENPTSKMFRVWTPGQTRSYDVVHKLTGDEEMNNSFATISPGGRWLVSGEWFTEKRLLVYPMPLLNSDASDPSADLPLAASVRLDQGVPDVQGCDFETPTRLLCSSDGVIDGVVKPLFSVDLARPLDGSDVAGHVAVVGALPLRSPCTSGTFEVEGLDVTDEVLRVEVVQPGACVAVTNVWTFRRTG